MDHNQSNQITKEEKKKKSKSKFWNAAIFLKHEAWLLSPLLMDNGVAIHIINKYLFCIYSSTSKQTFRERERERENLGEERNWGGRGATADES